MYNATSLIDKLMEYYGVNTISELSEMIKIGQPAISKWKNNNSITAIKKKCKELGIYNEIFEDMNTNINSFSQTGENSQQVHTQHNTGAGMVVHPNADALNNDTIKKEDELQALFNALVAVSNVLNKKDKLKEELTKLISKLPTL